ncbi:proline-rich protein 36 [Galendromus occidentalis]|uniref:Proline-rich protein 36 n=1 Tax=Galendromus occidentalis TaxID=34638 RepID=A0AAJ6QN96_9ACAR|nr:proline-rich protein 36 [Galendromus occidentalis]
MNSLRTYSNGIDKGLHAPRGAMELTIPWWGSPSAATKTRVEDVSEEDPQGNMEVSGSRIPRVLPTFDWSDDENCCEAPTFDIEPLQESNVNQKRIPDPQHGELLMPLLSWNLNSTSRTPPAVPDLGPKTLPPPTVDVLSPPSHFQLKEILPFSNTPPLMSGAVTVPVRKSFQDVPFHPSPAPLPTAPRPATGLIPLPSPSAPLLQPPPPYGLSRLSNPNLSVNIPFKPPPPYSSSLKSSRSVSAPSIPRALNTPGVTSAPSSVLSIQNAPPASQSPLPPLPPLIPITSNREPNQSRLLPSLTERSESAAEPRLGSSLNKESAPTTPVEPPKAPEAKATPPRRLARMKTTVKRAMIDQPPTSEMPSGNRDPQSGEPLFKKPYPPPSLPVAPIAREEVVPRLEARSSAPSLSLPLQSAVQKNETPVEKDKPRKRHIPLVPTPSFIPPILMRNTSMSNNRGEPKDPGALLFRVPPPTQSWPDTAVRAAPSLAVEPQIFKKPYPPKRQVDAPEKRSHIIVDFSKISTLASPQMCGGSGNSENLRSVIRGRD